MLMMFHGLFHWNDLAAIKFRNVNILPQTVPFHIPKSKTDQIGEGATLSIAVDKDSPFCPVKLTRRNLALFQSPDFGWLLPRLCAVKWLAAIPVILFHLFDRSPSSSSQVGSGRPSLYLRNTLVGEMEPPPLTPQDLLGWTSREWAVVVFCFFLSLAAPAILAIMSVDRFSSHI